MDQELYHHGVRGMKWGVRRYQTKDGSLTPRGRKHYREAKSAYQDVKRANRDVYERAKYSAKRRYNADQAKLYEGKKSLGKSDSIRNRQLKDRYKQDLKNAKKEYKRNTANSQEAQAYREAKSERRKRNAKIAAGALATAAVVGGIGAVAANKYIRSQNGQIAIAYGKDAAQSMFKQASAAGYTPEAARRSASNLQKEVRRRYENADLKTATYNVYNYKVASQREKARKRRVAKSDAAYRKRTGTSAYGF